MYSVIVLRSKIGQISLVLLQGCVFLYSPLVFDTCSNCSYRQLIKMSHSNFKLIFNLKVGRTHAIIIMHKTEAISNV